MEWAIFEIEIEIHTNEIGANQGPTNFKLHFHF